MSKTVYHADFEKFVKSLTPEQIIFLGSLIEKSIENKDFALLDQLASVMYESIKNVDIDELHKKTLKKFSILSIENNK